MVIWKSQFGKISLKWHFLAFLRVFWIININYTKAWLVLSSKMDVQEIAIQLCFCVKQVDYFFHSLWDTLFSGREQPRITNLPWVWLTLSIICSCNHISHFTITKDSKLICFCKSIFISVLCLNMQYEYCYFYICYDVVYG